MGTGFVRTTRAAVLLAAAAALGIAAVPVRPPVAARLSLSSGHVLSGAPVTIRGSGWGRATTGCSVLVRLKAYVIGVSPYPTSVIPPSAVDATGSFVRRWTVPRVSDRLQWTIRAEQQCASGSPTVRTATLVIG